MSHQADVSLNAATSTGPGSVITFDEPKSAVSMQVVVTGSPTDADVVIEGSLDGTTFTTLTASTNYASSHNGEIASFSGKPVLAVRANLTTLIGGSSPTVTAKILAAD